MEDKMEIKTDDDIKTSQQEIVAKLKRSELGDLKQKFEESFQQFSERVKCVAESAFPGTPDDFIQLISADTMIKGCDDQTIKEILEDLNINTIGEALYFYDYGQQKLSINTYQIEPSEYDTQNLTTVVPTNQDSMFENIDSNTYNNEYKPDELYTDKTEEDYELLENLNLLAFSNKEKEEDAEGMGEEKDAVEEEKDDGGEEKDDEGGKEQDDEVGEEKGDEGEEEKDDEEGEDGEGDNEGDEGGEEGEGDNEGDEGGEDEGREDEGGDSEEDGEGEDEGDEGEEQDGEGWEDNCEGVVEENDDNEKKSEEQTCLSVDIEINQKQKQQRKQPITNSWKETKHKFNLLVKSIVADNEKVNNRQTKADVVIGTKLEAKIQNPKEQTTKRSVTYDDILNVCNIINCLAPAAVYYPDDIIRSKLESRKHMYWIKHDETFLEDLNHRESLDDHIENTTVEHFSKSCLKHGKQTHTADKCLQTEEYKFQHQPSQTQHAVNDKQLTSFKIQNKLIKLAKEFDNMHVCQSYQNVNAEPGYKDHGLADAILREIQNRTDINILDKETGKLKDKVKDESKIENIEQRLEEKEVKISTKARQISEIARLTRQRNWVKAKKLQRQSEINMKNRENSSRKETCHSFQKDSKRKRKSTERPRIKTFRECISSKMKIRSHPLIHI